MINIHRFRGKVGQAYEPEEVKGKWFFTVWVARLGGGEVAELGTYGPIDTEEAALKELKTQIELLSRHVASQIGSDPNKYIDMNTNELKDWKEWKVK
jgi:hypothetical protein